MEKQYSLKRIRHHFRTGLNGTPFPEYRNIEDCKAEIESWYEWDSFNNFLIRGFSQGDAQAKLEKLKVIVKDLTP